MAVSSCAASREPPLPGFRACPHPPPCGLRCNRLYPADRSRRDTVPFLRFTLKPTRWLLLLHLQSAGLFPKMPGSLAPRGQSRPLPAGSALEPGSCGKSRRRAPVSPQASAGGSVPPPSFVHLSVPTGGIRMGALGRGVWVEVRGQNTRLASVLVAQS